MGNQDTGNVREKKDKAYRFEKLPENIRQMGEQPGKNRVYIEDYVVTYMRQIFREKQEQAIVILVGKKGEGEAKDARFVYGAIEIELDIMEGSKCIQAETWEEIYELMYQYFQGAEVLGWGCGVGMWSNQVDGMLLQIQKKHFSEEGKIFFLEDLSEKEQKLFDWEDGDRKELSGYVIYYEKNPQMQEFMLRGQPKESFEESYRDRVTADVRAVIQRKEEQKNPKRLVAYSVGVLLVLLTLLGANLLVQSTRKIDSLEKTIETLSNAATTVTEVSDTKESNTKESDTKEKVEKALEPEVKEISAETVAIPFPTDELTPSPSVTALPVYTEKPVEKKRKNTKKKAQEKEEKESSTAKPSSVVQAGKKTVESYVVRAGDTLSQIVWRQYHTLSYMDLVKEANNITDGDKIMEGQTILLPEF